MRCLVIGCGSIGTRRARLLAEMGHEVHGMDAEPVRAANATGGHAVDPIQAWSLVVPYDAVFICTPVGVRVDLVAEAVKAGVRGLFIEKPVAVDVDTAEAMLEALDHTGIITMGACNMRFDRRLEVVGRRTPTTLLFDMGQHHSHWSANHEPITLMLDDIHELDLARFLGGPIEGIEGWSTIRRADALVRHKNGARSHIHLNRIADPPHRSVTSYEGHDRIVADLWPTDPEMYRREMQHFLECVEHNRPTINPLTQAAETLGWALEVVG